MLLDLAALVLAVAVQAPAGDTVLPPAFMDPGVEELVRSARVARDRKVEGIGSYQATIRERIYVGLKSGLFRRERGLFQQERIARVRWSQDGDRIVAWEGARARVPLVGLGTDVPGEFRDEYGADLLEGQSLPFMSLDPGDSRLVFGNNTFVHPLSDSAEASYRFASGDTLTVSLPDGRSIVLVEASVRPRRHSYSLVAGSLWFDAATGALVRATYRPARPFDLELDDPEDAADVPGILKPIRADIDYVTVDYSLQELRWWMPRRFGFEGWAQLGRALRIPVTLEWTVGGYELNEPASGLLAGGRLPPGWTRAEVRREREGDRPPEYVTILSPPVDSLASSPALSDSPPAPDPTAFTDAEIRDMQVELQGLLSAFVPRASFAWGLQDGLTRFNRIEGLSVGVAGEVPVGPVSSLYATARLGTADLEPNGEVSFRYGTESRRRSIAVFRRLETTSDWSSPFSLGSSINNVLFGHNQSQFYRAHGVELTDRAAGRRTTRELQLFWEVHEAARKETEFRLWKVVDDEPLADNIEARAGSVGGTRGMLLWQAGVDPGTGVLSGRALGEVGWGDFDYRRLRGSVAATRSLFLGLAGAVEVGAGATWGDAPVQRHFYIGGSRTLRGFRTGELSGPSFWFARAEVSSDFPGARIGLFGDLGKLAPRRELDFRDPLATIGVGASFLDGLFRMDLARILRGGNEFRFHVYLDGLL